MRQKSILMTVLISAALLLGAITPASAASPPRGPQPEVKKAAEKNDKKQNDKAEHKDKDKDKHKCDDFRHPCKAKPSPEVIPASTTGDAMPKWFLLANGFSQENDLLVLTDTRTTPETGVQLVIAPVQPGSRGQLWRAERLASPFESYAYLHNGLGNSLLLSYQGVCGDGAPAVVYPAQTNSPISTSADYFQRWSHQRAGTVTIGEEEVSTAVINNLNCGLLALTAQGAAPGSAVVLASTGGAGSRWFTWPNYPLDAILAAPAVPYPSGSTDEQKSAYETITRDLRFPATGPNAVTCVMAGITYFGVRCSYLNLNQSMSALELKVIIIRTKVAPPAGVSTQTWQGVADQLLEEFGSVDTVRTLYSKNYISAFEQLFTASNSTLNALIGDVFGSVDDSAGFNVKGTAAAVVNGVAYTILSALGPVASVVGNLMETAVNAANAANQGSPTQLTGQFVIAANALWDQLSDSFLTVVTTLNDQQTAILLSNFGGRDCLTHPGTEGGGGTTTNVSLTLPAYSELGFGILYNNDGLEVTVRIYDTSWSTTTSVLSYVVHQHDCDLIESKDTWVDNDFYNQGTDYRFFGFTTTTQGSDNPGAIGTSIYQQ